MNILFVSMYQVSEQKGGTERTTARLSNELRKRGHRCYNLYKKSIDSSFEITDFDGAFTVNVQLLPLQISWINIL